MKSLQGWLLLVLIMLFMSGCGGGGGTGGNAPQAAGGIKFSLDLNSLRSSAAKSLASVAPAPITAVSVTLTRSGYTDITQQLSVAGNLASGTIPGLASGYWHVSANVYNNDALLYVGAVDVKVIAGAEVSAQILFDPFVTDPEPTTGTVSLSVGYNKFPGYARVNQAVSNILQDTVTGKIYIFDSSLSTIAVYNADSMVREKDIILASPPRAVAVEMGGGAILLGYSTGKIYRLNVADEGLTQLADSLVSISSLVPITSQILLVTNANGWGPSNIYKTINLSTGQTLDTKSDWYPISNFTLNPSNGMVYGLDSGLSPADIHRVKVNSSTGTIDVIADSRYHGDYYFGAPIRVINNGSRIATGSGNMFISSSLDSDDITYAGNLGHSFVDLVSDDALGNLYMLNSDNIKKLLVLDQSNLFTTLSVDIPATPQRIFNTANGIVVFIQSDSDYYVKIFNKHSLGLQ